MRKLLLLPLALLIASCTTNPAGPRKQVQDLTNQLAATNAALVAAQMEALKAQTQAQVDAAVTEARIKPRLIPEVHQLTSDLRSVTPSMGVVESGDAGLAAMLQRFLDNQAVVANPTPTQPAPRAFESAPNPPNSTSLSGDDWRRMEMMMKGIVQDQLQDQLGKQ